MSVTKFIGSGLKKVSSSIRERISNSKPPPKEEFTDVPFSVLQRARYANKLYAAMRSNYNPGTRYRPFSQESREFKTFIKLATMCDPLVDLVVWMEAHFVVYGLSTYPTRLISHCSYELYSKHLTQISATKVDPSHTELVEEELKLLRDLCEDWGATEEEVFIKSTPLFPTLSEQLRGTEVWQKVRSFRSQ